MDKELLNTIDNSINSILWISEKEFQNSSRYFQEFNYLTSGILEKKESNLVGLYQTQSFNNILNIALINKAADQSTLLAVESTLSILIKDSPSKILIVHEGVEDKLVEKFSKKYKKHTFLEFSPKEDTTDE
ncbi:hypothetical protein [Halobacteriovorax sp. JY17]|uniref:hypothetical protein n=1 Tax=Halobacteriovorax sp. JY17 TaxID=2014617 RepID=UPI000C6C3682|nr:hypothetical protein [Halobacteriovorax sp. JY17]PIK16444.1 MAG: hypothetical protein CES88_06805 [Halobacteriovorax sp. JY17]